VFKRDNSTFTSIPDFIVSNPKIYVNVCEDIGPATKIVPTMQLPVIQNHDHIFSVDDDIFYPKDLFSLFIKTKSRHPGCVLTGTSLYPSPKKYADGMRECELLEGFSSVLYQRSHLVSFDSEKLKSDPKYCYLSDDLVLSNHVISLGYKILVFNKQHPLIEAIKPFNYGFGSDALHKGASGATECKPEDPNCNVSNYNKCIGYLKDNNRYFFNFLH
jgi:hypothetical protein